jgi:hypothetical protein
MRRAIWMQADGKETGRFQIDRSRQPDRACPAGTYEMLPNTSDGSPGQASKGQISQRVTSSSNDADRRHGQKAEKGPRDVAQQWHSDTRVRQCWQFGGSSCRKRGES